MYCVSNCNVLALLSFMHCHLVEIERRGGPLSISCRLAYSCFQYNFLKGASETRMIEHSVTQMQVNIYLERENDGKEPL